MKKLSLLIILIITCLQGYSQQYEIEAFQKDLESFYTNYTIDGLVNYEQLHQNPQSLNQLVEVVNEGVLGLNEKETSAWKIHAYNLIVLKSLIDQYPVKSPKAIPGFFTTDRKIAGALQSLDELETDITASLKDGRIHYLLVCGAISCPPLLFFDVRNLENAFKQSEAIFIKDSRHVQLKSEEKQLIISKIFDWYQDELGGNEGIIKTIKKYHPEVTDEYSINYSPYIWSINSTVSSNENIRYQPTRLYAHKEFEVKWFSNYYIQLQNGNNSNQKTYSSFYTQIITSTVGTKWNLNIGPILRLRSVTQFSKGDASFLSGIKHQNIPFNTNDNITYARYGITAAGAQLRHELKTKSGRTFLMIHSLYVPTLKEAEGNQEFGFTDWEGLQYWLQVWFDRNISEKWNIFYDFGIFADNLSLKLIRPDPIFFQLTNNNNVIVNYFPVNKHTVYGLINVSPQLGIFNQDGNNSFSGGGYGQAGVGYKYFISKNLELELLGSLFFDTVEGRSAQTLNFGIRYNS